jgi:hypothetical protein
LNFFTNELKDIFLKIEVKRKKWQAFKTNNNGLLIILPVLCYCRGFMLSLIDAFGKGKYSNAPILSKNHQSGIMGNYP